MLALPEPPQPLSPCLLFYLQMEVPSCFRDAVVRHHENLAVLARNLGAACLPSDEVMRLLNEAVESYRTELSANLSAAEEIWNG